ncbi:hypothetical protein TCE0_034f12091, partial [Talaromyces pinophilus]
EVD